MRFRVASHGSLLTRRHQHPWRQGLLRKTAGVAGAALAVAAGAGTAALGITIPTSTPAGGSSPPVERVGQAPYVAPSATWIGDLPGKTPIQAEVILSPADPSRLENYAIAVSTPGNSLYHHYISPAQFASRFGASETVVQAVVNELTNEGLHVSPVTANHLSVPVSGTATAFTQAFSINFNEYRLSSGHVAYANTAAPQFSAGVAQDVQGVIGLSTTSVPQPLGLDGAPQSQATTPEPQVATGGPQPCTTAQQDAASDGVLTADQLASAYRFSGLYGADDQGSGVTVGLIELEAQLHLGHRCLPVVLRDEYHYQLYPGRWRCGWS